MYTNRRYGESKMRNMFSMFSSFSMFGRRKTSNENYVTYNGERVTYNNQNVIQG